MKRQQSKGCLWQQSWFYFSRLWKCWERNQKQEQQVLRVGIDSELSTADVSLAMDNTAADVMSQVGEGLFSFDEKGEAKPAL